MDQELNIEESKENAVKLFSQRAISIATYLGGPLATGILARQNFINLGKQELGKMSLLIGVLSSIFVFGGIFLVPDTILDKIPNALIPLVYTGIAYFVIERYQGAELETHKINNQPFYSAWRATGIGTVCMILLLGIIFGFAYLFPANDEYNNGIAVFDKNEKNALLLFSLIDSSSHKKIIDHIDNVGIPAWQHNIQLLDSLDKIKGLDEKYIEQNDLLRQYSKLRLESFKLFRKTFEEDSDKYYQQIEDLDKQIIRVLNKM